MEASPWEGEDMGLGADLVPEDLTQDLTWGHKPRPLEAFMGMDLPLASLPMLGPSTLATISLAVASQTCRGMGGGGETLEG